MSHIYLGIPICDLCRGRNSRRSHRRVIMRHAVEEADGLQEDGFRSSRSFAVHLKHWGLREVTITFYPVRRSLIPSIAYYPWRA